MGSNLTTGCPIHLNISGQIDLGRINTFTSCQICSKCPGFRDISRNLHLPHLCSIFSHGGHLGRLAGSSDTVLEQDTSVMIVTKFGEIWPCSFRGEDFCKS